MFIFVTFWNVFILPSVLWRCWLGGRKGIRPVNNWVVGCWRGCLGWGSDLHIAHQMPLPLTISCSSKSRLVLPFLVLPFWYLLTRAIEDKFQKSSKTIVCVCVCHVSNVLNVFTARRSASAVLAVVVCLYVCPSVCHTPVLWQMDTLIQTNRQTDRHTTTAYTRSVVRHDWGARRLEQEPLLL